MINGCLVGMVAICAGANVFAPYISLVMGFFSGFIYLMLAWLVLCFKIDDPLNAVAVHFGKLQNAFLTF
jgi:Amt family ammonium transporter